MEKFLDWLAWSFRERKPLGASDLPDERDWTPDKMFGGDIPDKIFENEELVDLTNVYANKQEGEDCTAHGSSGVSEIMLRFGVNYNEVNDNIIRNIDAKVSGLWHDQHFVYDDPEGHKTMGSANDLKGDSLQNALKTLRIRGIPVLIGSHICIVRIKGYARITDEEVDEWLERGHPVFTGCRWVLGKVNGLYRAYDENGFLFENGKGKDVYGHAWCIVGKWLDKNGKKVRKILNSHGERWGLFRNGTALISEQKLSECFSKYIIHLDWEYILEQIKNPAYAQQQHNIYQLKRRS